MHWATWGTQYKALGELAASTFEAWRLFRLWAAPIRFGVLASAGDQVRRDSLSTASHCERRLPQSLEHLIIFQADDIVSAKYLEEILHKADEFASVQGILVTGSGEEVIPF